MHLLLEKCILSDVFHETNFGTTPYFLADKRGSTKILKAFQEFTSSKISKEKVERDQTGKAAKPRFLSDVKELNEIYPTTYNGGIKIKLRTT